MLLPALGYAIVFALGVVIGSQTARRRMRHRVLRHLDAFEADITAPR